MPRRDLIGEHRRKYGLLPSVRRQARRQKQFERATRVGDKTIVRVIVR